MSHILRTSTEHKTASLAELNFGELGLKDVLVASVKGDTTDVRSTYILIISNYISLYGV